MVNRGADMLLDGSQFFCHRHSGLNDVLDVLGNALCTVGETRRVRVDDKKWTREVKPFVFNQGYAPPYIQRVIPRE